jgi:uncharacterized membrane protein
VLKVLVAYVVVGGAVWLSLDPIRRLFVLPALFTVATRGLILAFLPVVLAVAWRYPELGGGEAGDGRDPEA